MFEFCLEPVETKLRPYCGYPVCLLMKDGSRKIGRMTACRKGSVILNGEAQSERAAVATHRGGGRRASKARSRSRKPQSTVSHAAESAREGMPFAPLSLEPLAFIAAQKDQVPLQKIDSVLIL